MKHFPILLVSAVVLLFLGAALAFGGAILTAGAFLLPTHVETEVESVVEGSAGVGYESAPLLPDEAGPAAADPPEDAAMTLDDFTALLTRAVSTRNFELLRAHMAPNFVTAYWLSEGVELSAEEALVLLQQNYLLEGNPIAFDDTADVVALLGGVEPQGMLGPDANVVAVPLSTGWGAGGADEAMLFIAETVDGSYVWKGFLLAGGGF